MILLGDEGNAAVNALTRDDLYNSIISISGWLHVNTKCASDTTRGTWRRIGLRWPDTQERSLHWEVFDMRSYLPPTSSRYSIASPALSGYSRTTNAM